MIVEYYLWIEYLIFYSVMKGHSSQVNTGYCNVGFILNIDDLLIAFELM